VQSDEALDALAEAHVPEGAQVLTLQVIKPDGRRLEPDAIAGKDTISLPSVAVGDYVEMEFVMAKEAPSGLPGAYVGERFYFKSFEIPFDHSEMVVVLPASMPYIIDGRGDAPAVEETVEGDSRVLHWTVEQSRPLRMEPGSVSAREYIPSVRVGANASWPRFIDGLREALADRDSRDPDHVRLAAKIVGKLPPDAHVQRAQRIYAWVLDNIENTNDMFSQAAVMVRSRTGNRARVLHYLLGLAGVPSQLALASAVYADQTPSQLADGERYDHLLVRMGSDERPTWLYTVERWAPFGFVPAPLRGQEALLLAQDAPRVRVRAAVPAEDHRALAIELKLERTGRAEFEVLETVHGHGAIAWRTRLESVPQAELDRRFEQEYLARLVPGARLTSLAIADGQTRKPSIELRYSFEVMRLGHRMNNGWVLPALLTTELSKSYAQVNERTTDQLVASPLDLGVSLRIELPAGTRKPPLPEPSRIVAAVGGRPVFELSHQAQGDVVQIERRIHMPVMRVAAREYPAFATFCREVDAAEGRQLVFVMPD
jgi:hypothetical protein